MAIGDTIALLFRIGADSKQAQEEIKKLRKTYEDELNKLGDAPANSLLLLGQRAGFSAQAMGQLRSTIPAVATALTAAAGSALAASVAVLGLARAAANADGEIFKLSRNTGVSVETLSALRLAANESRTSIAEFGSALDDFNQLVGKANRGSEEARQTLLKFGIDPLTALHRQEETLARLFKIINDLPPGIQRALAAQELFGRSGDRLVAMFEAVGGNLDAFIGRARELGVVLDEQGARQAQEFNQELAQLTTQIRELANQMGRELIPMIRGQIKNLQTDLRDNRDQWRGWGQFVVEQLHNVVTGARLVINTITSQEFQDSFNILGAFPRRLEAVTNPPVPGLGDVAPVQVPSLAAPVRPSREPTAEEARVAAEAEKKRREAEVAAEKAAREAAQARQRILSVELQHVEANYRAQIEAAENAYQQMGISHAEYVSQVRAAEKARLEAVLANIAKELQEAERTLENPALEARRRELSQQRLDAQLEYNTRLAAIRDRAVAAELESLRELQQRKEEIDRIADERAVARIREARENRERRDRADLETALRQRKVERPRDVSEGTLDVEQSVVDRALEEIRQRALTHAQAEEQIITLERAALTRRKAYLDELLGIEGLSAQQRATIQHELQVLAEETRAFEEDTGRRTTAAKERDAQEQEATRQRDLENRRRYYEELKTLEKEQGDIGLFGAGADDPTDKMNKAAYGTLNILGELRKTGVQTFGMIAQSMGTLINQWVQLGTVGPNATRKMLSAIMAAVAAEAAVKAIFQLAEGFAKLAGFMPGQAALHFKAAALYGIIAGVAAGVGRAVAPPAEATGGASAGFGATETPATGTPDRTIREERRGVVVQVNIRRDPGSIVEVVAESFQKNGRIREMITEGR